MDVLARDVTLAALTASGSGLNKRLEIIAQNIANVNTPNYERRDVSFTEELTNALSTPANSRQERVSNVMGAVAREVVAENLFYRPDMGGVDVDREMAEMAKTQLKNNAIQQLIYKKFRQYRSVIKDGRV